MPELLDLEKAVVAHVVLTLEPKLRMHRDTLREELDRLGELLPLLVRSCRRRITGRRRRRRVRRG